MPIQDSNISRRNLVVWSCAIIIFYLGGGALENDTLSLPIVNVQLADPSAIWWVPWACLLWFAYRFRMVHRGMFEEEIQKEIWRVWKNDRMFKAIEHDLEENGISIVGVIRSENPISANSGLLRVIGVKVNIVHWLTSLATFRSVALGSGWQIILGRDVVEFGHYETIKSDDVQIYDLSTKIGRKLFLFCFQKPATSYLIPNTLWKIAVGLGLYSYVTSLPLFQGAG